MKHNEEKPWIDWFALTFVQNINTVLTMWRTSLFVRFHEKLQQWWFSWESTKSVQWHFQKTRHCHKNQWFCQIAENIKMFTTKGLLCLRIFNQPAKQEKCLQLVVFVKETTICWQKCHPISQVNVAEENELEHWFLLHVGENIPGSSTIVNNVPISCKWEGSMHSWRIWTTDDTMRAESRCEVLHWVRCGDISNLNVTFSGRRIDLVDFDRLFSRSLEKHHLGSSHSSLSRKSARRQEDFVPKNSSGKEKREKQKSQSVSFSFRVALLPKASPVMDEDGVVH